MMPCSSAMMTWAAAAAAAIVLLLAPRASAFLPVGVNKADVMRSELMDITQQQADTKLNLRLDIGVPGQSQMAITGMMIELHSDPLDAGDVSHRVLLPGYDGPHRDLSCGPRRLDVLEKGRYVDLMGTQHVEALRGCWEMSWREGKPAGTLICGFEIPKEYRRNQASLPKGILYCSFPLWTKEGLAIGQAQRDLLSQRAKNLLAVRDDELQKHNTSRNPIMKAVHFRKAFDAFDEYNTLPLNGLDNIPSTKDVIELQNDLLLTHKGMVWLNHGEFKDAKHTVLGTAILSSTKKASSGNLAP